MYYLRYSGIRFSLLPAPYDTDCDPSILQESCLRACVTRDMLNRTERLPFTEIITQARTGERVLSYDDLMDPTLKEEVARVESECEKLCSRKTCHFAYTSTYAQEAL